MAQAEDAFVEDDSGSETLESYFHHREVSPTSDNPAITDDDMLHAIDLPLPEMPGFSSAEATDDGWNVSSEDEEDDSPALLGSPWRCCTQQVTTVIVSTEPPTVLEKSQPATAPPIPRRGASPSTFYGAKARKQHAAIRRKFVICVVGCEQSRFFFPNLVMKLYTKLLNCTLFNRVKQFEFFARQREQRQQERQRRASAAVTHVTRGHQSRRSNLPPSASSTRGIRQLQQHLQDPLHRQHSPEPPPIQPCIIYVDDPIETRVPPGLLLPRRASYMHRF